LIFTSSTGDTLVAGGTAGTVAVKLEQRATVRNTGASMVAGATTTAAVTGTVLVPGKPTASQAASDTYVVAGLDSKVTGTTSFAPNRIPAGTSSIVTITGQNTSNGPLATLTISEPSDNTMFSNDVTFDGFRIGGSAMPSGATSGTITWFVDSGTAPAPSFFTTIAGLPSGIPSLDPGQRITGFAAEFAGSIATGAIARLAYRLAVSGDYAGLTGFARITDEPRIDGVNDAGAATPALPTATLVVLDPVVDLTLDKTIAPTVPVPALGRQLVQLTATTASDSGYVSPRNITIIDVRGTDPLDYWNAFDAQAINATPVSLGSTLRVSYTTDGTTWTVLAYVDATSSAKTYRGALPSPATIVGLKFEFENLSGYAQGTVVRPSINFIARATLRDTTNPTATLASNVTGIHPRKLRRNPRVR
jgi:hypothetical protein